MVTYRFATSANLRVHHVIVVKFLEHLPMICTKGWQVSYGITEHVEHVLKTIPNLGNCRVLHCKIKKLNTWVYYNIIHHLRSGTGVYKLMRRSKFLS